MSQPEDTEYGRCEATAKSTDERCGRAATGDHGKCNYHGGRAGAPEGNDNGVGNAGGDGGPPGNTKAMKHGLNMTIERQYRNFGETEREAFRFYVEYYRTERELDDLVQAKRLAIAEVMADRVETDLADSMYRMEYSDAGKGYEVPKEGMLDAHMQYITTIRLKQHYEGISRHPSADGNSSAAEQFLKQLPAGSSGGNEGADPNVDADADSGGGE